MLLKDLQEGEQKNPTGFPDNSRPDTSLGISYYASSFDYEQVEGEEETVDKVKAMQNFIFLPVQSDINDDTTVLLTKLGTVKQKLKWKDMLKWLEDNFNELQGQYNIEDEQGTVLHSFRTSN